MKRIDIEKREREMLAPYAAFSAESRGRVYPQPEHELRTDFQRDRDRIIHSTAFRRMEYKTQVFIPHETDHFRTRLTHTIEVAQISRTIARSLQLNEDLTEAIALVHDLGHTPFGHSGEGVLDGLIREFGGFNHNHQSLRIVDLLEQRYDQHPGLNLTYEVREGIVKHETTVIKMFPEFNQQLYPTLEASLVDIADEIAYNAHDIDDGLSSGLITFEDIKKTDLWEFFDLEQDKIFNSLNPDQKRYTLARKMINIMTTDLINETKRKLIELEITDLNSVRTAMEKIPGYSVEIKEQVMKIKEFLFHKLYRHPDLLEMTTWAQEIIETLYEKLLSQPDLLPARFIEMLKTERPQIVVADYIAGMTDRFAVQLYSQLEKRQ